MVGETVYNKRKQTKEMNNSIGQEFSYNNVVVSLTTTLWGFHVYYQFSTLAPS